MKSEVRTHKDLEVWKNSIDLVTDIYKITGIFPRSEEFSMVSQTRRASVWVPLNIAEDAARNSRKEFIHF